MVNRTVSFEIVFANFSLWPMYQHWTKDMQEGWRVIVGPVCIAIATTVWDRRLPTMERTYRS